MEDIWNVESMHDASSNEMYFQCPACQKRVHTRFSLQRHYKRHTGVKPFVCMHDGCGKRFSESSTLKRHIRTHTGERPYACSFPGCSKRFSDPTNVRRHETSHSARKPFVCPIEMCTREFSRGNSLKLHLCSVHHYGQGDEVLKLACKRSYQLKYQAARDKNMLSSNRHSV